MQMTQVLKLARNLMDSHGLQHMGLKISKTKRALGSCHYVYDYASRSHKPSYISLSKHWMENIPEHDVRDTILHEIAHALAGSSAKHGPVWKAMCRKIGANPSRVSELPTNIIMEVKQQISNYTAKCTKCDNTHHFDRYTEKWRKGRYVCGRCSAPFSVFKN